MTTTRVDLNDGGVWVTNSSLNPATDDSGLKTEIAGRTLALTDREAGKVWVQDVSLTRPINKDEDEPNISDFPQPIITVTPRGVVHAFSADTHPIYESPPRNKT